MVGFSNAVKLRKPWGYELIWAHTERYAGKIIHIEAGECLSYQYHQVKDETIYLLTGLLELELGMENERVKHRLEAGSGYHIRPGTRHRLRALSACDILEASTPELNDVVRIEDAYGRV